MHIYNVTSGKYTGVQMGDSAIAPAKLTYENKNNTIEQFFQKNSI
jgi:hypothetical protein